MSDQNENHRSLAVGPLQGIRVVGVEHFIAGPYATQLLADQGADVIKVEAPGAEQRNHYFHTINRNKRSVMLDLKSPEGKEVLYELVRSADVLVTNFAVDVPDRLGYGYEAMRAINPNLIYAHVTGFGHGGPYSNKAAFDGVIQSMSGIVHLTGDRDGLPMLPGFFIPDHLTGLYAAFAVTLAIRHREITGTGSFIDLAMLDSMLSFNGSHYLEVLQEHESPKRDGSRVRKSYASTYAAADGYVYLCPLTAKMWEGVANAIGHPEVTSHFSVENPRVDTRLEYRDELDALITAWIESHTVAEILEAMNDAGVAASSIYSIEDIVADPHIAHRGMIQTVPAAKGAVSDVYVPANPMPVIETAYSIPPPGAGEHTAEILAELGFPADYLAGSRS